ncbi:MAG: AraC family transcriptional regulator [Planctomycetota bacterium]|nr:AraC family transcriptional regulator [Planctomycetota bacterium]
MSQPFVVAASALLRVIDPVADWPRPSMVCVSSTAHPGYCYSGVERGDDLRCGIQLTLAGCGRLGYGARDYVLGPGQGFVHRIADPACSYRYAPGDPRWHFVFVELHGVSDAVAALVASLGPVFALDDTAPLRARLLRQAEAGSVSLSAAEAARMAWDYIALAQEALSAGVVGGSLGVCRAARRYMLEHIYDNPGMAAVAAACGVSAAHLSRSFRRHEGCTPLQALHRLQVTEAESLLRFGRISSEDLAQRLGYSSGTNFARVFKRVRGCTPSALRSG